MPKIQTGKIDWKTIFRISVSRPILDLLFFFILKIKFLEKIKSEEG
jgi:hypothetical protein